MARGVLFFLGLVLPLLAHAQDIRGTVFELQTDGSRVPSAGAFIVVHWTGTRPGLGHYETVCYQAAVARTDANGQFEIAEPPALRSTLFVWRRDPAAAVYKPGYDERSEARVHGRRQEMTLVPTRMDAPSRASLAESFGRLGCHDDKGDPIALTDPQGVLAAFHGALASEMPTKAPPKLDVRIIQRKSPLPAAVQ